MYVCIYVCMQLSGSGVHILLFVYKHNLVSQSRGLQVSASIMRCVGHTRGAGGERPEEKGHTCSIQIYPPEACSRS